MTSNKLYALLIGIDCYFPNVLPGGNCIANLRGCVRDITKVEEFLKSKLGMQSECILKLTASNIGNTKPPESPEQWPTYENMVAAFQKLTEIAQPGDQVYIQYSGHGSRIPTDFPELKTNGLDESLVPTDICNSQTRYLRDLELAYLLNRMVEKGLIVTVVLDSCHSGGMVRGSGSVAIRGINEIDRTERSAQSLVASDVELAETWRHLYSNTTRSLKLGSGWLPEPKGYVLLAACRPSESAKEFAFNGKERNGVLTYWLLDSLKQIGTGFTYKLIHDRVVAKVHSQFQQQTPQLQGEGNRVVFGSDFMQPLYAVNVIQTDLANQRILLNTGQSQALSKGTKFVIYPPGQTNFSQIDKRLALVEIVQLGATESWTRIIEKFGSTPIEEGYQAVLLDITDLCLRRKICLVYQDILPKTIDQTTALKRVEDALRQNESGFLELVQDDEPIDYEIVVNSNEEYEIWNLGRQTIPNLHPAIRCSDHDAAVRLIDRLVHLTKFHNILQLDNANSLSPLSRKLLVELAGMRRSDYDPMHPPKPIPFNDPGNTPTLKPGEWTFIRVRNNSLKVLNIAVLDLQPDWGITQIYPSEQDTDFWPLDPGEEVLLPLQAHLPSGYADVKDVIKVFATVGATNFRWLELPPLDQPSARSASTFSQPQNALEELLASVAPLTQDKRHLSTAAYLSFEWVTSQVEIHIQI